MREKKQTYRASYVREEANPFTPDLKEYSANFRCIKVELTKKQAETKDKLAKAATPKGYRFVDCIYVG